MTRRRLTETELREIIFRFLMELHKAQDIAEFAAVTAEAMDAEMEVYIKESY